MNFDLNETQPVNSPNPSFIDSFDEVALVTVTYHSEQLASFFAGTAKAFRNVYVIDNASRDATAAAFSKAVPHAKVLVQDENLGFGPANNVGLQAANEAGMKYVLFLNPDCKIEPEHFSRMLASIKNCASAGILCGRMFDENGAPYPVRQCDYTRPYQHRQVTVADLSACDDGLVHQACIDGSCILARSDIFNRMGGFNPDLFMYNEEDDLAIRLTRMGFEVVVDINAHATHLGGASSPKTLKLELRKAYHARWSRFLMSDRYIGKGYRLRKALEGMLVAPIAIAVYAILFRKKDVIKWTGWWAAAMDGIAMTKFFRRVL